MGITDWTDELLHSADQAWRGVDEMFEPVLRLGVTGLSGAGKTVFITALVSSLMSRQEQCPIGWCNSVLRL